MSSWWQRARLWLLEVKERASSVFGLDLGDALAPNTGPGRSSLELWATWTLVAVGLFFRARGVLFGEPIQMWNDESSWAMRMFERPLSEHLIRPPGYVLLTRLSAVLFRYNEFGFRLLPWLAGMAAPIVAVLLARRFLRNAGSRVLFVGILSLSLYAIDFSKEFKQYSIGLFVQLLLPLLALRWVESKSQRDLVVVSVVAALALLFSQDVLFLYPGLFTLLLVESWLRKDRRQMLVAFVAGAATLALILTMHSLLWRRIDQETAENHWGRRYDVFFLDGQGRKAKAQGSELTWLAGKYRDMAAMPGARRNFWSEEGVLAGEKLEKAAQADLWLWLGLHALGLAALLRHRRWRELLLFWSPVAVCTALNLLGRWPIGAFRTNLFLIPGMAALASATFEWFKPGEAKARSLAPVFAIVIMPMLLFERAFHARKPGAYAAGVLTLIKTLSVERGPADGRKEPLYMDTHACSPFRYYTGYHPSGKRVWEKLKDRVEPICGGQKRTLKTASKLGRKKRAWLLYTGRVKVPRQLKELARFEKLNQKLIKVQRR